MSSPVYTWMIVYDDGTTEEREGYGIYDFADDLVKDVIAIIREPTTW